MAQVADDLNQIGFLLGRAYYSYIGLLERRLEEAGLSEYCKPGMGSVLFALYRQDDRTLTELAAELQIAKSTMTGMVARMKKTGLVTLRRDDDDQRSTRLKLTPRARSLETSCRRLAGDVERFLCDGFSDSQQRQLRTGLARLIQTTAGELSAAGPATSRPRKKEIHV
jgi:DNA-binding MarR family transcriptional regulator